MLFLPIGWTSNITQSIVYVFLLLNICLNPPVIYQQTLLLLLVLVLHSVHVFLVFLMSSACFLFHFFHMFSHTCLKLCVFHNFSGFLFIIFVCLFLVCFPSQNCLFLYFLISYAPFFFTFSREFWSGHDIHIYLFLLYVARTTCSFLWWANIYLRQIRQSADIKNKQKKLSMWYMA